MKDIKPYQDGPQFVEGFVFVLRKVGVPPKYFVRDLYPKPHDYWSPVASMAKRFGHRLLAIDFSRYLEQKPINPDNPCGVVEIVQLIHRETITAKMLMERPEFKAQKTLAERTLAEYLTTYNNDGTFFGLGTPEAEKVNKVYRPKVVTNDDLAAALLKSYRGGLK